MVGGPDSQQLQNGLRPVVPDRCEERHRDGKNDHRIVGWNGHRAKRGDTRVGISRTLPVGFQKSRYDLTCGCPLTLAGDRDPTRQDGLLLVLFAQLTAALPLA